jgi:hypothetical protein
LEDFVKVLGAIGENADKLGALGLLLLVNAMFLYGLAKDKIVTGNRWQEKLKAEAETKEALRAALSELTAVKEALTKLQVEKDLLWRNTSLPSTRTRKRRATQ